MPKKSKAKRAGVDARGYKQSQKKLQTASLSSCSVADAGTATTRTPALSNNTLQKLQQQAAVAAATNNTNTTGSLVETASPATANVDNVQTNAVDVKKMASKLEAVVRQLDTLNFSNDQIQDMVTALQTRSVSLDAVLDWYCLHYPLDQLPSILIDTRLQTTRGNSSSTDPSLSTLTVLKMSAPPSNVKAKGTNDNNVDEKKGKERLLELQKQKEVREQEEAREKAELKARLLQKYEYEKVEAASENNPGAPGQVQKQEETGDEAVVTLSSSLKTLEHQWQQAQAELADLEADVNNEANNYMRSKQEIQQLKRDLRHKREFVRGLQRKVEKERATAAAAAATTTTANRKDAANEKTVKSDQEEAEGCIMSLFGNDKNDESNGYDPEGDEMYGGWLFDTSTPAPKDAVEANTKEPSPPPAARRLDPVAAIVPEGWTGSTPQKLLQERCHKLKRPGPKYTKISFPERGFRLSMAGEKQQQSWQAIEADVTKGSSVQNYLALQALWEMEDGNNQSLSLDRRLPPDFAVLWRSWQQAVIDARKKEQQAGVDAYQERINNLLSLITATSTTTSNNTRGPSKKAPIISENDGEEPSLPAEQDDWDDQENNNIAASMAEKPITPLGQRLRNEFQTRQKKSAYQQMLQARQTLPMASFRETILKTIQNHPVTILSADVGAGKSTQCPQYLLEQALLDGRGDAINIIVTQPRRVAATSVAERVSEEMCCPSFGQQVGYQIRMQARKSFQTRILFCTTGIVLRRLQDDPTLADATHILVDEVHERQQQTDVLLVALRTLLRTTRPDLKVVLMSATLDTDLFCSFFEGAPLVQVPGRTFPVYDYYLEDLLEATGHMIEPGSRYALREQWSKENRTVLNITTRGSEQRQQIVDLDLELESEVSDLYPTYSLATRKSMDRVNEQVINYDLIEDLLELLLCQPEQNTYLLVKRNETGETIDLFRSGGGSVLIFLPGLEEIRTLKERLEGNQNLQGLDIVPMHSTLSAQDQRRAFIVDGTRCKIILATNICETSVTIPDVVCVIDTGRVREVRRNKRTSTTILVQDWCSKASAKQRAGRAGRVREGLCLKLYSSHTATEVMKAASEPELRRVPLEEICLSLLASGLATGSCMEFLSQAPQPPTTESVHSATDTLQAVGAVIVNEESINGNKRRMERLTVLGQHLARLPVDVRLGKMLIFGTLFRCIDKIVTIAAALSCQPIFSTYLASPEAKAKQAAFHDSDSDFITLCNVWEAYSQAVQESNRAARQLCQNSFLNLAALREIADARRQFAELLSNIGFLDSPRGKNYGLPNFESSPFNENGNNMELVHAVICAGLYPNVARLTQPTVGDYTMFHKEERLYFHASSVNSKKKRHNDGSWVVFFEKFGTPNRVSVSIAGPVHPFALLLFGGSVTVKHLERRVHIDDWIQMNMAAQTGVVLKDFRTRLDAWLEFLITHNDEASAKPFNRDIIQGMAALLVASSP